MELASPISWFLASIGLGYLVAQLFAFVFLVYAHENGKLSLGGVGKVQLHILKMLNLIFGFGLGFLVLAAVLIKAAREHLPEHHELPAFAFVASSFVFFSLFIVILNILKLDAPRNKDH